MEPSDFFIFSWYLQAQKMSFLVWTWTHEKSNERTKFFCAFMSRLSCVHESFLRSCSCPDFRAFTSLRFPDYVILNARRPPLPVIFGLDILASVWDLRLGCMHYWIIVYLLIARLISAIFCLNPKLTKNWEGVLCSIKWSEFFSSYIFRAVRNS